MALSKDAAAVRAFQRFGLGPKAEGLKPIVDDPRGALVAELEAAQPDAGTKAAQPDQTTASPRERPTVAGAIALRLEFAKAEQQRRNVARLEPGMAAPAAAQDMGGASAANGVTQAPTSSQPAMGERTRPPEAILYEEDCALRFESAAAAPIGFVERWAMFWSNHFCIDVSKGAIARVAAGAYEREVIRPHMLGRFADLLIAVEKSPPMLFYLDQQLSIGPNSQAGKRRGRGLNENLAREILELHTVGVNGGYTQADVTSFARVLTGWTYAGLENKQHAPGTFFFNANMHEPGEHAVMGKTYPVAGLDRGERVLRDLAIHPATARFVASKLARRFVADEPAPALVESLAERFRKSDGDLSELARNLITMDAAWDAPAGKLRSPTEFLAAALRAFSDGAPSNQPLGGPQFLFFLRLMGQPLWSPPGPNGFADTEAVLAAPESIRMRLDVAAQMARRKGGGIEPLARAESLFGGTLSAETRQAIARAESRPQGLAILLMSPEFSRR